MERFTAAFCPISMLATNLARYLVRDPHEAEEAVQESFLRRSGISTASAAWMGVRGC
jgi:DNA-directed RNA polymerase specialized sigma24 family protein